MARASIALFLGRHFERADGGFEVVAGNGHGVGADIFVTVTVGMGADLALELPQSLAAGAEELAFG
jgi:hypothetical protein